MKIGEVARLAGVRAETVRYYEKRGIMSAPRRTDSNYRVYSAEAVRRVIFVKRAQTLGFTLIEICDLLSLNSAGDSARGKVRASAERKLRDIESKIEALSAMRSALSSLIADCACGGGTDECPILNAFSAESPEITDGGISNE